MAAIVGLQVASEAVVDLADLGEVARDQRVSVAAWRVLARWRGASDQAVDVAPRITSDADDDQDRGVAAAQQQAGRQLTRAGRSAVVFRADEAGC